MGRDDILGATEQRVKSMKDDDLDPKETQEWLDALASVLEKEGPERAGFLVSELQAALALSGASLSKPWAAPYLNSLAEDLPYPGNRAIENRISAINRWNAVCMVLKATDFAPELGGHLSTFASSAVLYQVAFFHCFKGPDHPSGADLVFFQGHASPGMYAEAFLEGRLSVEQVSHFRQEIGVKGLSSYPHPYLMPDFWQFPTVSMGLGPLQAIYQARFLRYLHHRGLANTQDRYVWAFCGDGEMDEPESTGALHIAKKEDLDNLIFVVNCNLQRLDGPVRGNGSVVRELASVFQGAGWNVIKVLWSKDWEALLEKDQSGLLMRRMAECVDGEYQAFQAHDGAYLRKHFFGKYPELEALVADMTDEQLYRLRRGGHDWEKVYTAYQTALNLKNGSPTVILAKTVKGYGLGAAGESLNTAHNTKKMTLDQLRIFRDRFEVPIKEADLESFPLYRPSEDSEEVQYVLQQRKLLGGPVPVRRESSEVFAAPPLSAFQVQLEDSGDREISTTMVFVRILQTLLKNPDFGKRVVPIVPDESRTFGMEGMFRQFGIYSHLGQLYEPEDRQQVMYYREAVDGQVLQEGINEAGAMCSWMAAGSSYANHQVTMIPFYIYYSMFGFQRIGDLAWAAGDMQVQGFLIGAVAGRTTLAGEGLQHQDGHSHIMADTIPNCVSYDPTYAYELAVIIRSGLHRMYEKREKIFYYIAVMNENYHHPAMPEGAEAGIVQGLYLLRSRAAAKLRVQLLGSGAILREVEAAADLLAADFEIGADIWSATSFNELGREAKACDRWNHFHPGETPKEAYITRCLKNQEGPVIAATDYIRAYAEQVRAFIPKPYLVLGTDGFGRSDTREKLRAFFEVNRFYIAYAAMKALYDAGQITLDTLMKAQKHYQIDPEKLDPVKS